MKKQQLKVFAFDIPISDDIPTKTFTIQGRISEKTTASLYQKDEIDCIRINVVVEDTNEAQKKCELGITQNTPKHPNVLRIPNALWYGYIIARKQEEVIELNVHITEI